MHSFGPLERTCWSMEIAGTSKHQEILEGHSNGYPSYYLQQERYTGEMSIARQYAGQKVWPRAVYVRRARFYHSARLRWSAIERRRGPLEDILIDDLAEWSMWHYPSGKSGLQCC